MDKGANKPANKKAVKHEQFPSISEHVYREDLAAVAAQRAEQRIATTAVFDQEKQQMATQASLLKLHNLERSSAGIDSKDDDGYVNQFALDSKTGDTKQEVRVSRLESDSVSTPNLHEYQRAGAHGPANMRIVRRGSLCKKPTMSKKQKYVEMDAELMAMRYTLFYADDIVQVGLQCKSEVRYKKIMGEQDPQFMRKLRETQGIFFEIDVGPESPRKSKERSKSGLLLPFSKDPNKGTSEHSFSDNGAASRRQQIGLPKQTVAPDSADNNACESPCWRQQKHVEPQIQQSNKEVTAAKLSKKLLDDMLLNSSGDEGGSLNERASLGSVDQHLTCTLETAQSVSDDNGGVNKPSKKDKPNMASVEVLDMDEANTPNDQMKKVSSFLNSHYQSPNIADIKRTIRRREIEEIDRKVAEGHHIQLVRQQHPGEVKDHRDDPMVEKQAFWRNHAASSPAKGRLRIPNPEKTDDNDKVKDAQQQDQWNNYKIIEAQDELSGASPSRSNQSPRQVPSSGRQDQGTQLEEIEGEDVSFEKKNRASDSEISVRHDSDRGERSCIDVPLNHGLSGVKTPFNYDVDYERKLPAEPTSALIPKPRKGLGMKRMESFIGGVNKDGMKSALGRLTLDKTENNSEVNSIESVSSGSGQSINARDELKLRAIFSMISSKVCIGERHKSKRLEIQMRSSSVLRDSVDLQSSKLPGMSSNVRATLTSNYGDFSRRSRQRSTQNFQSTQMERPVARMSKVLRGIPSQLHDSNELTLKMVTTEKTPPAGGFLETPNQSIPKIAQTDGYFGKIPHTRGISQPPPHQRQRTNEMSNQAVENMPRLTTDQRRQRRREIKRLAQPIMPRLSPEEEEEERIIKAQKRGLKHLKRICETLLDKKLTENCVGEADLQGVDASNDDVTTVQRVNEERGERSLNTLHVSDDKREATPTGIQFQQSIYSKVPSQTASTPNQNLGDSSQQTSFQPTQSNAGGNEAARLSHASAARSDNNFKGYQFDLSQTNKLVQLLKPKQDSERLHERGPSAKDMFHSQAIAKEASAVQNIREPADGSRGSPGKSDFDGSKKETSMSISGLGGQRRFELHVQHIDFSMRTKTMHSDEGASQSQLSRGNQVATFDQQRKLKPVNTEQSLLLQAASSNTLKRQREAALNLSKATKTELLGRKDINDYNVFLQRQLEEEKSEEVKAPLPSLEDHKFSTAKFDQNDFMAAHGMSDAENSPLTATIERDIRKRPADLIIFDASAEQQIQSPVSPYLPHESANQVGREPVSGTETAVFVRQQVSNEYQSNASPVAGHNKTVELGDRMEVEMESMRQRSRQPMQTQVRPEQITRQRSPPRPQLLPLLEFENRQRRAQMSPHGDYGAISGDGEIGPIIIEDQDVPSGRRNAQSTAVSPVSLNKQVNADLQQFGDSLRFQPNELNSGASAHKRVMTNHGFNTSVNQGNSSRKNSGGVLLVHRPAQVLSVGKRPHQSDESSFEGNEEIERNIDRLLASKKMSGRNVDVDFRQINSVSGEGSEFSFRKSQRNIAEQRAKFELSMHRAETFSFEKATMQGRMSPVNLPSGLPSMLDESSSSQMSREKKSSSRRGQPQRTQKQGIQLNLKLCEHAERKSQEPPINRLPSRSRERTSNNIEQPKASIQPLKTFAADARPVSNERHCSSRPANRVNEAAVLHVEPVAALNRSVPHGGRLVNPTAFQQVAGVDAALLNDQISDILKQGVHSAANSAKKPRPAVKNYTPQASNLEKYPNDIQTAPAPLSLSGHPNGRVVTNMLVPSSNPFKCSQVSPLTKSGESLLTSQMQVKETENSINDSQSVHLQRQKGQGLRDDVNLDVSDDNISVGLSSLQKQPFNRANMNRASIGGMLFAAQHKQISTSAELDVQKKKSANLRPLPRDLQDAFMRGSFHKHPENVKLSIVSEDLDELANAMSRHYQNRMGKKKKKKKPQVVVEDPAESLMASPQHSQVYPTVASGIVPLRAQKSDTRSVISRTQSKTKATARLAPSRPDKIESQWLVPSASMATPDDQQSIYYGSESHMGDELASQSALAAMAHGLSQSSTVGLATRDLRFAQRVQKTPERRENAIVASQRTAQPARKKIVSPSTTQLSITKKHSQYSSYSQSRKLGYSNYFEEQYAKPAAQGLLQNAPQQFTMKMRYARTFHENEGPDIASIGAVHSQVMPVTTSGNAFKRANTLKSEQQQIQQKKIVPQQHQNLQQSMRSQKRNKALENMLPMTSMIFNQRMNQVSKEPASSPYFEGAGRMSFTMGAGQNRPSQDSSGLQQQYASFDRSGKFGADNSLLNHCQEEEDVFERANDFEDVNESPFFDQGETRNVAGLKLKQAIEQQLKEPRMPVYYEEDRRHSLLSETHQQQSLKFGISFEVGKGQENPFAPGTMDKQKSKGSSGAVSFNAVSNSNSGKTGAFIPAPSDEQHLAQQAVRLRLEGPIESEPMQAAAVQMRRAQMLRKD